MGEREQSVVRQAGSTEDSGSAAATFARSGEYWTLAYGGSSFSLKDSKGLAYIQHLLQHPGQEFHALDLLAIGAAQDSDAEITAASKSGELRIGRAGDAGEMLDAQAKQQYRRRLTELKQELEEYNQRGDHAGAEKIESEIDFLTREIARAVGLGGRDRRAGSAAERARLNVTRAIKAVLLRIADNNAPLAELLNRTVRTGTFCSYTPDPRLNVTWLLSLGGSPPAAAESIETPVLSHREAVFPRALVHRTGFVGREAERATLGRCLEQASQGQGSLVLISGPPGVGKTRLCDEAGTQAVQMGFLALAGGCYDRDDSAPFTPFVEILEEALAQAPDPQEFREALGSDAPEIARLMPQLRRLFRDLQQPLEAQAEQSRRLLFNAIANVLARTARRRPVLLLLEDLHWADEGSLSLLNHLARMISKIPAVILATYRAHDVDPGGPLAATIDELTRQRLAQRIALEGLPQSAVAEMIRSLSGREPAKAVVDFIYSGTEGNPFFVEELFLHLSERGKLAGTQRNFAMDATDVPQSLRVIIGRRLAGLGDPVQKTLSAAAVIGPSFTFELLEKATGIDSEKLLDDVEDAERSGLISGTMEHSETRFQFSHELVRQTVLAGVSAPRLQRLHLAAALAIEQLYGKTAEDKVNDLAHHFWLAGAIADAGKTAGYLALAAKSALQQSAYDAVLRDTCNALELLNKMGETPERARRELELQLTRGIALVATKGWYAPEAGEVYTRARGLCEQFDEDPQLISVLFGLWSFHLIRGEHPKALAYGEEMLTTALRMKDQGMTVQAYWAVGCSEFFLGDFPRSLEHVRQGIALYDSRQHSRLAFLFAQDPYMSSLVFEAIDLWMLGYPDQGESRAQEALAFARQLGYPFSVAWCMEELAVYYSVRGDFELADKVIEQGLPLVGEQGYLQLESGLQACRLIGLAARGRMQEFIEISATMPNFANPGYEIRGTWARAALAEAFARAGNLSGADALIKDALAAMERNEERFIEPDIYRVAGEIALRQMAAGESTEMPATQPEDQFRKAIQLAQMRGAKMLELRAAVSLAGFLGQNGRAAEGEQLLKQICSEFSEGFDTPEFKQARTMSGEPPEEPGGRD